MRKRISDSPEAGIPATPEKISDQALLERLVGLARKIQTIRRPLPEGMMSESEFVILSALSGKGQEMMTMKRLSERSGMPPSLISRVVNGLEEKKQFVERVPSKDDRRQVYIRITEEGERALRKYVKRRIERLRPLVSAMDGEERTLVWRSVDIFEAALLRNVALKKSAVGRKEP
ncbi:MAG: MarR family transcriptional regulator [Pseudomonadota bacterium]